MLLSQCLLFSSTVRQVIPVIQGNSTGLQTSSGVTTLAGKKKRKKRDTSDADKLARIHGDGLDYDMWRRPEAYRATDRARRSPVEPLESRILNKKRRMLRLMGLQEVETREKRSIVPR